MNALGEVCPVCGGRMRQSQYALICAQEFGPCGLLYHKFSGRNRQGGKTEFNHTRLGKSPFMAVRGASLKVCFGGDGLISEDVFSARLNGEQEPPRKAPPGKRAIVIRQGTQR